MAITATHYKLLSSLPIQRGSSLLEIGEANWYGDIDPQSVGLKRHPSDFDTAKELYQQLFAPTRLVAVDKTGTPVARRDDLNLPLDLGEQFDVVINHGTSEHIFNIAQVFASIHDACELDGWMIHDAPFTGWIDHGFYCLQPTLFYDLARVNCYEIAKVAIHDFRSQQIIEVRSQEHVRALAESGSIPNNSMLFVAFRKRYAVRFGTPVQGYYQRAIQGAA